MNLLQLSLPVEKEDLVAAGFEMIEITYEEKNLSLLKKIDELRTKIWTLVIEDTSVHDIEIEIYDSKCPNCQKIISSSLKQCNYCKVKFSKSKAKRITKFDAPGKGKKFCPGCEFYVAVRTHNCDCGYDFKNKIQKESTISKQKIFKNIKKKKSENVKISDVLDLDMLISNDIRASNILKLKDCSSILIKDLVKEFIKTRNKIVDFNFKLSISNARKWIHKCKHLKLEDLIQYAVFGQFKAIDHFKLDKKTLDDNDNEKNICYSTYATWWIDREILNAVAKFEKEIRIPEHILNDYKKYKTFYEKYKNEYGSEPSIEEIQKALKVKKKKAEGLVFARQYGKGNSILLDDITNFVDSDSADAKNKSFQKLSMFRNGGLESFDLVDNIPEENLEFKSIDWDKVKFIKPHYREIFFKMKGLFGYPESTISEISDEYKITKVTLYKIERDTMTRIKKQLLGAK